MAQRIHILGLGKSGVGAALLARRKGFDVSATDMKEAGALPEYEALKSAGVRLDLGQHDPDLFREADLIIVSPGVGKVGLLEQAAASGVRVISEVEFAAGMMASGIIAVTGTNGKSTVTTMIADIMKKGPAPVWAGGNLGTALSGAVGGEVDTPEGWVVLELSSFQLERIEVFRPRVAMILNITPDHFDRYATLDDYAAAKCNIFRNQGKRDHLLIPGGNDEIRHRCTAARSVLHAIGGEDGELRLEDGIIRVRGLGGPEVDIDPARCNLKNSLLISNAMFAIAASILAGAGTQQVVEGLAAFKPLRHRFQLVDEIDGVRWINDSKATNPESAIKAIEAAGRNVILLAGGLGKGLDFSPLAGGVRGRVKAAILFGKSAGEIRGVIEPEVGVEEVSSLRRAMERARALASAGDTVLLAPGCASFDMFRNFEDRGDRFISLVHELKEKAQV
ncbi:MAG: UDP-N-acetylmuramoyl-L-alanine--D-glutamate ligase [Pseudomonadota bacterium]